LLWLPLLSIFDLLLPDKRPTASGLADGQLAINTASGTPGLFLKDNAGAVVKVGPVHVGAAAPNATPAGSSGNSKGELWVNDTTTIHGLNYYTGSAFVNLTPSGTATTAGLVELATNAETQAGTDTVRAVTPSGLQSKVSDSTSTTSSTTIASSTAVKAAFDLANAALPKSGGRVTGNLEIGPTGSLSFEGSTDDSFETFLEVVDPTADRTITFPNVTGTVVTTGDTGTVTSAMITDGTIVNADINASAGIVDTKLATISTAGKVSNSATTAVSTNTVNAIVTRDGSGNFSAGTITAALTGNASTATKLSSARTFAVTGDITGTVSSDLTSGASIATSIAAGVIIDADVNASAAIGLSKLATGALPSGITVASANIVDGTIVNADINASAAIALSKLATGALPSAITVASTNIVDGTIVNADVNASAAIAGTKIAPNFGSQTITTTGVISSALGTAAAPSIAFTGDLNTGIFSPGADQVAVATNGVGRLFVNSTGLVQVNGNLAGGRDLTQFVRLNGDASANYVQGVSLPGNSKPFVIEPDTNSSSLQLRTSTENPILFTTNSSERLRITSAGLVGIGTSSPLAKIHVRGAGQATAAIADAGDLGNFIRVSESSTSTGAGGGILFSSQQGDSANSVGFAAIKGLLSNGNGNTTGHLAIFTRDATADTALTERVRITSAGNVGIGTTSPAYPLEVARNNGVIGFIPDSVNGNTIRFGGVGGTANQLIFTGASDLERARIDSSGRLLVGTSTSVGVASVGNAPFQISTSTIAAGFYSVANSQGPGGVLALGHGRTTSAGLLSASDVLAEVRFAGGDGTDLESIAAQVQALVDGTPGANDMPGRLVFSTTAKRGEFSDGADED
jgi:hypothetical protein